MLNTQAPFKAPVTIIFSSILSISYIEERQRQLSVLLAQWQGYRSKRREEKKSLMPQNRKCLEEACALKLESIKAEIEGHHHQQQRQAGGGASKSVRDIDAYAELLTRLQKTQDDECRKIRNVGSKVNLSDKITRIKTSCHGRINRKRTKCCKILDRRIMKVFNT